MDALLSMEAVPFAPLGEGEVDTDTVAEGVSLACGELDEVWQKEPEGVKEGEADGEGEELLLAH